MSRTVGEWLRARDEWRVDNKMKISALNPLTSDSIVYKRESSNFYWHEKWEDVKNLVPTHISFTFRN
jgi:hypothetical protein